MDANKWQELMECAFENLKYAKRLLTCSVGTRK